MENNLKDGISIIICCYNSGWIIQRTLGALKDQIIEREIPYEIVLVDNNCQDNTVGIAKQAMKDCTIDFRIVEENRAGLVFARQRGIEEVRYKYAIYCDDDNLLCSTYVQKIYEILSSNPQIGAAGGKGIAEFEVEPAEIVKQKIEGYAIGSQIQHRDWLFGAGLAIRTELVREIYQKQRCFLMGRRGNKLLSGDDSELVFSIVLRGYNIHPTDIIYFIHVLKANRLTTEYCEKLYKGFQESAPVLDVMRAVIYNRGFETILQKYFICLRRLLRHSIIRTSPRAKEIRKECCAWVQATHFWGLSTLFRIYNEWTIIKLEYQKQVHLS